MAGRPFWSGQIKMSLVSFGVELFPATDTQAGIRFHEVERSTGRRIHHLNVAGNDRRVDSGNIAKGFEYSKGKYLIVEPDEIANLRIETKRVLEIEQFVELNSLPPALFEKPYFVLPGAKGSVDAFAVVRKAMEQTQKAGIGEIAFAGREHLVAIAVPNDPEQRGLMAYTLRYGEELRSSKDYFSGIPDAKIDKKQLAMATELIHAYSRPLKLEKFKDDYEEALRALLDAKRKNQPLPIDQERAKSPKVVDLMDALRRSVAQSKGSTHGDRSSARNGRAKKGPVLVKPAKRKRRAA